MLCARNVIDLLIDVLLLQQCCTECANITKHWESVLQLVVPPILPVCCNSQCAACMEAAEVLLYSTLSQRCGGVAAQQGYSHVLHWQLHCFHSSDVPSPSSEGWRQGYLQSFGPWHQDCSRTGTEGRGQLDVGADCTWHQLQDPPKGVSCETRSSLQEGARPMQLLPLQCADAAMC